MPVKKGYKQSPEHIARRIKRGEAHWNWRGNEIKPEAGRLRAWRTYKDIGPCTRCGNPKSERHHKDGNTLNNAPENIEILCRRCHLTVDGRLEKGIALLKRVNGRGRAIAIANRKAKTHCQRGHELSGDNLMFQKHGTRRLCRACFEAAQRRWVETHRERSREIQRQYQLRKKANSSTPTSA